MNDTTKCAYCKNEIILNKDIISLPLFTIIAFECPYCEKAFKIKIHPITIYEGIK